MINLYIVDFVENKANPNGVMTYNNQLSNGFATKKEEVKVTKIWIFSVKYDALTKENSDNVNHIHVPAHIDYLSKSDTSQNELVNFLKLDMVGKSNIIVHFNWLIHFNLAKSLKESGINCKNVLTKHYIPWRSTIISNYNSFYILHENLKNKTKLSTITIDLHKEKKNYKYFDHIITVTELAKNSLVHICNILPEKISTIENGLSNPEDSKTSKASLKRKYGFDQSARILLFVGNVSAKKGVFDLIKAFQQIVAKDKNLHLVIIGEGDYNTAIKSCRKFWNKITFTGPLEKPLVNDFYRISDIGIMPSYIEQCSYTLIEMMHCGLPVIVSNIDGPNEMVKDGCGLKFRIEYKKNGLYFDEKGLIKNIKQIINDQNLSKSLAKKAKEYATSFFSLNNMVDKTLDVYNHVLEDRRININSSLKESWPLVAMIIVYCDHHESIKNCLENIYQDYQNLEVIILDCRKEKVFDTDESIKFKELKYIKCNTDYSILLNIEKICIKLKCKYLTILNPLNTYIPEKVSLQVDFLEKNKAFNAVFSLYNVVNSHNILIEKNERLVHSNIYLSMIFNDYFSCSAPLFTSDLLSQLTFDPRYDSCFENDLFYQLVKISKIQCIPEFLLSIHQPNVDRRKNDLNTKETIINLLSRELDYWNISHNENELMIHTAINYNITDYLLANLEAVRNWVQKVLSSRNLVEFYGESEILEVSANCETIKRYYSVDVKVDLI